MTHNDTQPVLFNFVQHLRRSSRKIPKDAGAILENATGLIEFGAQELAQKHKDEKRQRAQMN